MNTLEPEIKSESYAWHFKRLLIFGIPLVIAQILQMAIGVTDSIMVGRLGELPLAQIGLGASLMFFAIIAPMGYSIATSVLVSNAFARKDYLEVRRVVCMSLWQCLIFFAIAIPFLWNADAILRAIGQPEEAIIGAANYTRIVIWAMPFIYVSAVLRGYLTALERGNAMLIVSLLGFIANIFGNYALIYGKFGMPALGLEGSAFASVITNIVMTLVVFGLCIKDPMAKTIRVFSDIWQAHWPIFWRLFAIGTPIGIGLIAEVSMFQMATVMAGWISVSALAAHTIVLNIAGLTFMIPLGLSIATSVRAGNALGRGDREGLVKGVIVSYALVTSIMVLTAFAFWFAPEFFIEQFQDKNRDDMQEVALIATSMFVAAAVFQIFDGLQVVGISALRGMQDVKIPSILAFIAYWPIGVSLSYVFAFKMDMGGAGIWFGLACGLAVASVLLGVRFAIKSRQI